MIQFLLNILLSLHYLCYLFITIYIIKYQNTSMREKDQIYFSVNFMNILYQYDSPNLFRFIAN